MVQAAPNQPVHAHDHEADQYCGKEQDGKAARVSGGVDLRTQTDCRKCAIVQAGVFGEDRSVPCSTGCCNHASKEVWEDAGEDQSGPTLPAGEFVERSGFAEVGGDGHGSSYDVEEDVPLSAQQHQSD